MRRFSLETISDATLPEGIPLLRMLWAEITGSCNEHCDHCYNDSGAHRAADQSMSRDQWFRIFEDARSLGCQEIQFIGGEPMMVPWLPAAFAFARSLGFDKVEVYTNATKLSDVMFEAIVANGIHVAVSVYSNDPAEHDAITHLPGSHARTMRAIERLKAANVPLRVAVIAMPRNQSTCNETVDGLKLYGIENVGVDQARAFGRAEAVTGRTPELSELCGHCWKGTVCIDPQGNVSPCIMSRKWPVGNVSTTPLGDIVRGEVLARTRRDIYEKVYVPSLTVPATLLEPVAEVCLPGSDDLDRCIPGLLPEHVSSRRMKEDLAIGSSAGISACLPNSPNPTPSCIPYSTPPNPCGPHVCGPGTGPCYPLGG